MKKLILMLLLAGSIQGVYAQKQRRKTNSRPTLPYLKN